MHPQPWEEGKASLAKWPARPRERFRCTLCKQQQLLKGGGVGSDRSSGGSMVLGCWPALPLLEQGGPLPDAGSFLKMQHLLLPLEQCLSCAVTPNKQTNQA